MAEPTPRFLVSHPAHFVALGAGTGLAPKAPGTFGTLLAFPLWWVTLPLQSLVVWSLIAAAFVLGIWACSRTGRDLGVADHGSMVWDEVVAMWAVLLVTPFGWPWWLAAFILFRLFDIWKPFPVGYFDRTIKGGFGVMLDDALAAGYAILVIQTANFALQRGMA